ncbi:MAG: hypothetical protein IKK79_06115 [Spirochaetaceae bacterium]|nr:hypothetical protein [Spirochaetaceae bacterium]
MRYRLHILTILLFSWGLIFANSNNEILSQKKQIEGDFFSYGIFSSIDSIKTTVNLEVGFSLYRKNDFQIKSLTSIAGSKIFDDESNLYQLGLMEKITFGQTDFYQNEITSSRYGFFFASFGFMSFDKNRQTKFLFASPYYWEIGGGAGVNIRLKKTVAFLAELGGGLHLVQNGKGDFIKKLQKAGFGRMSMGFRYFLK